MIGRILARLIGQKNLAASPPDPDPRDFSSDAARKYHSSNQLGR